MIEKQIKSRTVHKHDIEANWKLAVNFTPQQGEIIVYDIDENYSYERFKIGDGSKNVNDLPFAGGGEIVNADWTQNDSTQPDYIKNRTHWQEDSIDINWDGTTTGRFFVSRVSDNQSVNYVHVSDLIPSDEDMLKLSTYFIGTARDTSNNTENISDPASLFLFETNEKYSSFCAGDDSPNIIIIKKANAIDSNELKYDLPGIYFMRWNVPVMNFVGFISNLHIEGNFNKIPKEYLSPSEWDDILNKPFGTIPSESEILNEQVIFGRKDDERLYAPLTTFDSKLFINDINYQITLNKTNRNLFYSTYQLNDGTEIPAFEIESNGYDISEHFGWIANLSGTYYLIIDVVEPAYGLLPGKGCKVSIKNNDPIILKLDEKYLPEMNSQEFKQINADWNQTDSSKADYIKNKPTIPSAYVHPGTHPASMITGLSTVATSGNYKDLQNIPDLTNFADKNYVSEAISNINIDIDTEDTILEKQEISGFLSEDNKFSVRLPGCILTEGETYKVFWDGKDYECVAFKFPNPEDFDKPLLKLMVMLGNLSYLEALLNETEVFNTTKEPFLFMSYSGSVENNEPAEILMSCASNICESDIHTVGIKHIRNINVNWNNISNKPFGEVETTLLINKDTVRPEVSFESLGETWVKITDEIITYEEYVNGIMKTNTPEAPETPVKDNIQTIVNNENGYAFLLIGEAPFAVCFNPCEMEINVPEFGMSDIANIPEAGIYTIEDIAAVILQGLEMSVDYKTIKKIDEKYLPILDYIPPVETDILPHTEFTCDSEVYMPYNKYGAHVASMLLEIGKEYTVVLDNVEYKCVAQDASAALEGAVVLGNGSDYGFDGNNEPFGIVTQDDGALILTYDDTEPSLSHTVRIYQVANDGGYKLKPEYLEELSSTQPDWNQNDNSQPDYIQNRPFYIGESVPFELFPATTMPFNFSGDDGFYMYTATPSSNELALLNSDWTEAIIQWDDNTYTVQPQYIQGIKFIGNVGLIIGTGNTGEPFVIMMADAASFGEDIFLIYSLLDAAPEDTSNAPTIEHTISCTLNMSDIHTIDSKFIKSIEWDKISDKPFGTYRSGTVVVDETVTIGAEITPLNTMNTDLFIGDAAYIAYLNGTAYTAKGFIEGSVKGINIYNSDGTSAAGIIDVLGGLFLDDFPVAVGNECTVKIVFDGDVIKKIDSVYLPDGVGGSSLPEVTTSDNNKVLTVVNGAWNASSIPTELPSVTTSDNNKVLTVVNGAWTAQTPASGLPEVTTSDAGKFLRVSADGLWAAESIPNAEEASF